MIGIPGYLQMERYTNKTLDIFQKIVLSMLKYQSITSNGKRTRMAQKPCVSGNIFWLFIYISSGAFLLGCFMFSASQIWQIWHELLETVFAHQHREIKQTLEVSCLNWFYETAWYYQLRPDKAKTNERKMWRCMPLCWSQSIRINVNKSSPVFVAVALNSWNSARSDGDLAFNQGCWVCRCSKTLKLDLAQGFLFAWNSVNHQATSPS